MPRHKIEEPVIVANWWKNRGGEEIRIRLLAYEGHGAERNSLLNVHVDRL